MYINIAYRNLLGQLSKDYIYLFTIIEKNIKDSLITFLSTFEKFSTFSI